MLGVLSRAPSQAVLQQLVGAGGAGSGHQAHSGFMQETFPWVTFLDNRLMVAMLVLGCPSSAMPDSHLPLCNLSATKYIEKQRASLVA